MKGYIMKKNPKRLLIGLPENEVTKKSHLSKFNGNIIRDEMLLGKTKKL